MDHGLCPVDRCEGGRRPTGSVQKRLSWMLRSTGIPNTRIRLELLNRAYRRGMTIEAVLQTPDGGWRVEIVKRGQTHWYRIVHGDNTIGWLSIAAVERILAEADVNMADLVDARTEPRPADNGQHGAA